MMHDVSRKAEHWLEQAWTRLTEQEIMVVRVLCQMTSSDGNCMMAALKAGTACLPGATAMRVANARDVMVTCWRRGGRRFCQSERGRVSA